MNAVIRDPLRGENVDLGDLPASLGFLLRLAQVQVFQAFFNALSERGLKPGEYTVLRVIGLNPGTRQGVIARALKIKPAHMTKLVQRMVVAGLVERIIPPDDRRSVNLILTDTGRSFIGAHEAELKHFQQTEGAGLSDDEFAQLLKLLQKLTGLGETP